MLPPGVRPGGGFPLRAPLVLVVLALLVAPALAATPLRYEPDVYRGAVGGGVPDATYHVHPLLGERIFVTSGTTDAGLWVRLIDPLNLQRESLRGAGRFELNADLQGAWRVVLSGPAARAADYTLTVGLLPNAPYAMDEGLEPGDAPSSCAGSHLIREGTWRGGLWAGDDADTFRLHAGIGDLLTLTLKPDDLDDGADFGIMLLDDRCLVLRHVDSSLGDAKASPENLYYWPVERTAVYYARVLRTDGLGNYQLAASVREPYPTVPMNDALSGRDPTGPGDAVPLAAPGTYQARLHDGDPSDWFLVPRTPGTTLDVVLMPGVASAVGVRVYDASLRLLYASAAVTPPGYLVVPHDAGPVYLAVDRLVGGGNYAFSVSERPR